MGKMKDILLKATMEYEEKLKRGAKSISMGDLHIEKCTYVLLEDVYSRPLGENELALCPECGKIIDCPTHKGVQYYNPHSNHQVTVCFDCTPAYDSNMGISRIIQSNCAEWDRFLSEIECRNEGIHEMDMENIIIGRNYFNKVANRTVKEIVKKHGIQPVYFLEGVPVDKDTLVELFPLLSMDK